MRRSPSSRLPPKPSSQAVLKLSRAVILRRYESPLPIPQTQSAFHCCERQTSFRLSRCTRTSPSILSTQVGCRLARRLRRRTKVQYAAVRSDGIIAFDYVIRRLNALSAGSEKPVGRLNLR